MAAEYEKIFNTHGLEELALPSMIKQIQFIPHQNFKNIQILRTHLKNLYGGWKDRLKYCLAHY